MAGTPFIQWEGTQMESPTCITCTPFLIRSSVTLRDGILGCRFRNNCLPCNTFYRGGGGGAGGVGLISHLRMDRRGVRMVEKEKKGRRTFFPRFEKDATCFRGFIEPTSIHTHVSTSSIPNNYFLSDMPPRPEVSCRHDRALKWRINYHFQIIHGDILSNGWQYNYIRLRDD